MKSNRRTNPPYLNGVPELLILHLLSAQPRHGYDLVQAIRASTGEELQFGEGCIYPILHRLESEGHLQSSRQMVAGRSRVIYRVTAKGKRQLADSVSAWQRVVEVVGRALKGSQDGQPEIA
jgi:PadR family transcriptional regulator PadR